MVKKKNIILKIVLVMCALVISAIITFELFIRQPISLSAFELRDDLNPLLEIDENALEDFPSFFTNHTSALDFELSVFDEIPDMIDFSNTQQQLQTLSMEHPQEVLHIVFENALREASSNIPEQNTFVLKLFYNYEVISFRPVNQHDFNHQFFFSLEEGYQVHIPIELGDEVEQNDYLNQLTVAIFATPERHTIDSTAPLQEQFNGEYYLLSNAIGIIRQFDLTLGGRKQISVGDFNTEVVRLFNGGFGLNVSPEFFESDIELNNGIISQPSPWRVNPKEEVILAFDSLLENFLYYPNPNPPDYPILENYLIIGLLNWEQITLNGAPYAFIDVEPRLPIGQIDYGFLSIDAPSEPGLYEFIAFAIPNPELPRENGIFSHSGGLPWRPHSMRFTIIVEGD